MEPRNLNLYKAQADIIRAVAHPIRLAILDFLQRGEQCVCKIAEHVGAQRSNVSRHLGLMTRSGVLASRKRGLMVLYRLRTPCVTNFLSCVQTVLREQIQESRRLLKHL